jgi:hypothetical protein
LLRKPFFLLILLFLMACQQDNVTTLTPTTAAANLTPTATRPQATPTRPATPTPTPEPQPAIAVTDQTVDDSGRITVQSVTSLTPAILALYADEEGAPGDFLTFVPITVGTTTDVPLIFNPLQATTTLHLRLLTDADQDNTPDDLTQPLVETRFNVTLVATLPSLSITDQAINEAGELRIESANVLGPAWVVIHNDEAGEPGAVIGFFPLTPETTYPLTITIRWREALPQLHALLNQDLGERGRFDATIDLPLIAQGQPINIPFHVTLPLDMTLLDQPVVNGTITIERVISNGDGWAVIYNDEGGQPGRIIGSAFLEDGLNTLVSVPLVENALTTNLFIWLHGDTGVSGQFEYPIADDVVRVDGRVPTPFALNTRPTNYLIAADQPFDTGEITVTTVVMNAPGWVVIHNDANGELGEIIGQVWVPAGISRELVVPFDLDGLTTTLHVALYNDLGQAEVFDADDTPWRVSGRVISVPIFLTD